MASATKYSRARVFISSRNTYELDGAPLSEVRAELVSQVEARFPFLEVRINEGWPATGRSPSDASKAGARDCALFVGILVNDGGFESVNGLTATTIEFAEAADQSRSKMLVFAQRALIDDPDPELDAEYAALVQQWLGFEDGKVVKPFDTGDELIAHVLDAVAAYCAHTVTWYAERYRAKVQTQTEATWELETFTARHEVIKDTLRSEAKRARGVQVDGPRNTMRLKRLPKDTQDLGAPDRYTLEFVERNVKLPVIVTACPDRFSSPDASRYVGYPFRTAVETWPEEIGPLHIVLVFRTVTDTQIRKHLGNPDIHVMRQKWGFFAADPERFIQIAYLTGCDGPEEVGQHVRDLLVWLDRYHQVDDLIERARTRGRILQVRSN
ncbi:MAG: hypothetical protein ACR2O6_02825 [Ilumatobacteraceae bacterium]